MKEQTPLAALREKIQAQRWKGTTQATIATNLGVTPSFLSQVLHGRKQLTIEMLAYIGWEKVTKYRRSRQ